MKLALIGVGLIGGSFAAALRAAGAVEEVVGFDADPQASAAGLARGVIDRVAANAGDAASGADVVVVATPVGAIRTALAGIAPSLSASAVITVVKKGGVVYMNDTPVSIDEMGQKLKAISKLNPNVFLKADKDVPYGFVVEVMGEIKEAGIEKLGMITEPKSSLK